MEKIKSFTVNHLNLKPGIYQSRKDNINETVIITYDLRITQPNLEPVMNTAEMHTIEHLGATYLRNHPKFGPKIIYFGPMGCRTGFYLLLSGESSNKSLRELIHSMFRYVADFIDEIPGAKAEDCGNYQDHNLPMARYIAEKYLETLATVYNPTFDYTE